MTFKSVASVSDTCLIPVWMPTVQGMFPGAMRKMLGRLMLSAFHGLITCVYLPSLCDLKQATQETARG